MKDEEWGDWDVQSDNYSKDNDFEEYNSVSADLKPPLES